MCCTKTLRVLAICLVVFGFSGCNYFKIASSFENGYEIEGALSRNKTIIVHTGNESWQLIFPSISRDQEHITARYSSVSYNHQFYRIAKKRTANRYSRKMGDPSNDVNIYISEYYLDSLNQINIPISAIKRIDVYQKENGRTVFSYVGVILGSYYGLLLMILLLSSI